jgi:hypothetical protein
MLYRQMPFSALWNNTLFTMALLNLWRLNVGYPGFVLLGMVSHPFPASFCYRFSQIHIYIYIYIISYHIIE